MKEKPKKIKKEKKKMNDQEEKKDGQAEKTGVRNDKKKSTYETMAARLRTNRVAVGLV